MKDLKFDLRGNLTPYEKINLTMDDFEKFFLFTESKTRKLLYESYKIYVNDLQKEISADVRQWIDGSFVTSKVNPNDIDIVTLLDFNIYEKKEKLIREKFRKYGSKNEYEGVDGYFVKSYPKHHKKFWVTEYDLAYWSNWFSETKKNRAKKKFPKGFVEISF